VSMGTGGAVAWWARGVAWWVGEKKLRLAAGGFGGWRRGVPWVSMGAWCVEGTPPDGGGFDGFVGMWAGEVVL